MRQWLLGISPRICCLVYKNLLYISKINPSIITQVIDEICKIGENPIKWINSLHCHHILSFYFFYAPSPNDQSSSVTSSSNDTQSHIRIAIERMRSLVMFATKARLKVDSDQRPARTIAFEERSFEIEKRKNKNYIFRILCVNQNVVKRSGTKRLNTCAKRALVYSICMNHIVGFARKRWNSADMNMWWQSERTQSQLNACSAFSTNNKREKATSLRSLIYLSFALCLQSSSG